MAETEQPPSNTIHKDQQMQSYNLAAHQCYTGTRGAREEETWTWTVNQAVNPALHAMLLGNRYLAYTLWHETLLRTATSHTPNHKD